jgi:hypothetical protein
MTSVTVLVGPGTTTGAAVRDQLRDWSASGFVSELFWVDVRDVVAGSPLSQVPADHVVDGAVVRASLQTHLANRQRVDRIRLTVLSVVSGRERALDHDVVATIRNALATLPTRPDVTALNCLAVVHGGGGWDAAAAWHGWHNVVISPEDAWTPRAVPNVLDGSVDLPSFAAHTAAAVSVLSGAWTGLPGSALDDEPVHGGPAVRLTRSFVRRIDAAAAGRAVRDRLMDLSAGLPRPQRGARALEYVDQPTTAARHVATAVLDRHADLFRPDREPLPHTERGALGGWEMLKLFLSFLWASLRAAPRQWVDRMKSRASAAAAQQVQNAVYGGNRADFDVVVRGVDAKGRPPGLDQMSAAVERLDASMRSEVAALEQTVPRTGDFWRDVAFGALTLADAGTHVAGVEPVMVGDLPGVVREPAQVCPPDAKPYVVPGGLVDDLGMREIEAADIWAFKRVIARADQVGHGGSGTALAASRAREEMIAIASPLRGSYLGMVGEPIGDAVESSARDVAHLLDELEAAATPPETPPSVLSEAERLARVLRVSTICWVVLSALVGVAAWREWLALDVSLYVLGGLLLVWVVVCAVAFYRSTQAEFALRMRRSVSEDELGVIRRNLARATRELRVHAMLYRQFLAWAPVLGAFFNAPFGTDAAGQDAPRFSGPIPRSLGLGVARPSPEHTRRVADQLAGQTFRPGWMAPLWERLLQDAVDEVTDATGRPVGNPDALFSDRLTEDDSPLRLFAQQVRTHGIGKGPGDALWAQARTHLADGGMEALFGSLLSTVRVDAQQRHGGLESLAGGEFLSGLIEAAGTEASAFHGDVLTNAARVGGAGAVVGSVLVCSSSGGLLPHATPAGTRVHEAAGAQGDLDQLVVLVQMSGQLQADQLVLLGGAATAVQDAPLGSGRPDRDDEGYLL